MTLKNLAKVSLGKAVLVVALPFLCMAGAVPAFAQTAEIRSAGVYYIDTGTGVDTETITEKYCAWTGSTLTDAEGSNPDINKSAITNVAHHQTNDPWDTSALIEYDQPFPSPQAANEYPNHCLSLCFDVYCTNKPNGATTYSISFPLQTVRFEIAKYYGSKDIVNPDTNPAVRIIQESVLNNQIINDNTGGTTPEGNLSDYMCAAYTCYGAKANFEDTTTCPNPEYECDSHEANATCKSLTDGSVTTASAAGCDPQVLCRKILDGTTGDALHHCVHYDSGTLGQDLECNCNGAETPCVVRTSKSGKGYNEPIRFCTAWDGSYEILGEFGKTNGQFGFRANVHTDYPGDGIAVENITVDDTYVYPGNNQYPIQVDVTNVHTVRTTPTVMGAITAVQATPYTIAYRLSKDADVKIQIFDASAVVPTTGATGNPGGTDGDVTGATLSGAQAQLILTNDSPVRNLVDWQPRLGEGMKGSDKDTIIVESDSWDGRDDNGRLLPANNYLVSIQAKTQDEWPGTDFSRAVTRQLSLDPLKLTDITVTGLSKQSTAYATINYVPTEASNVYFEVYTPGTTFDSIYTDGAANTGTAPTISPATSGTLVYSNHQQRGRGLKYPDKWDGLCHVEEGCTITYPKGSINPLTGEKVAATTTLNFANGAPMPDGDYVYVLWAEIPYADIYTDKAGRSYTGVKTQIYYTGIMPVERGVVDITIQPVGYATIGSSPTAYGLDPFIFKYSIAREAVVNAYVKNTAGVVVKTLTTGEGTNNTQVAQQMNTLTWDGRDDQGRMVGAGTYLFIVETRDPMFPNAVKTQASAQFPVDMYRLTDLSTTDVYGDSGAKATISYMLSKAMNVQINIYNKDVVIPVRSNTAGTPTVTTEDNTANVVGNAMLPGLTNTSLEATVTGATLVEGDEVGSTYYVYTDPTSSGSTYTYYRALKNVTAVDTVNNKEDYVVSEVLKYEVTAAPWPPRVCDQTTDSAYFTDGYVDPTKKPQCIYVNDTTFTNYPANPNAAKYNYAEGAAQTLDVRLQPVKTFNRSALRAGDGVRMTEEWDAQYFYNPTPVSLADGGKNTLEAVNACKNQTSLTACPYEMVPDGTYPFYISAQTEEPVDIYYDLTTAAPYRTAGEIKPQTGLYSTDKQVYRINITRGPVYFLDGSVVVYPNAPQLFNTSSGPVFVPPYEIDFAISRAATVEVAIVALQDGMCTTTREDGTSYSNLQYNNKAGDVCKYLSTMTIPNTANFDPNIVRRIYWDGTDNNGKYVRNGNYEFRLTAKNYPDEGLYQPTIKQVTQNIDLLKVFDLPDSEAYAINKRGTDMKISYQISVPMKVAIQIFKPGTTIYDYTKGTLRDPSTGKEVTDIRDVLVRAIVGIRPATTLIEEIWDGTDYAQQDVPDGTYPFRYVTALNSADIDSITGEILRGDDTATTPSSWKINQVADTFQYVNLHHATIAIGDGEFVCEDWEKTVFFYPNPFKTSTGTLEVTKLPVPGKMSIKMYNLAGDLVRESGYTCVDAQNMVTTLNGSLDVSPDNNVSDTTYTGHMRSLRNAALRCFWDKTNDHGKRVARGVYFGLVDFRAQNGRQHCQKVVKILIPR